MKFGFTHLLWLWAVLPAVAWTVWFHRHPGPVLSPWRSSLSLLTRLIIIAAVVLALAGLQLLRPQDGMFVYYLLDRSDSVPAGFQEAARNYVHRNAQTKKQGDRAGVIVFGSEASIESSAAAVLDLQKVQAVVSAEKTDIASAIRLAAAAFPEHGQKRITVLSDGNENSSDALEAVYAAKELGVTLDVVPLGSGQGNDAILQRVTIPSNVKRGQAFEVKVFVQSERAQSGILRLFRNDQYLGEQRISLEEGKNQIAFTQTLEQSGFYSYQAQIEVAGDPVPQNNRGTAFVTIRGNPRVLLVSSQPDQDGTLFAALKSAQFDVTFGGLDRMPGSLPEWQSYDTIFLSNIAAGDLGTEQMQRLESAVRDYGVGLVCVGGDQAFAAGGYRGTPLEATLPIDMELSSKKVLPKGALVLVVHATEFPNGNQWARDIAYAALDALGPQDELGVVLWDGKERWLFELAPVGDKKAVGKLISGMNPGDMVSFQGPMEMAADALAKSTANLKHMVVFSDGDPSAPRDSLLKSIVDRRISISSVMIGGHVTPETMIQMAEVGKGRFYDVRSPGQLPQIFIKEAAVILKSAIMERPFKPRVGGSSEVIRGIDPAGYPVLYGTVASTAKSRAEVPLVTPEGDPLLAHWQYGLGRSVAFTSDARSKWAKDWVSWDKYRQFWTQIALWSVRRLQPSDVNASMNVEGGRGLITVEALDADGNYRNFLNLQTLLTAPDGKSSTVALEQTGPGRYEARFPAGKEGAYLANLLEMRNGKAEGALMLGASVNCSPEFLNPRPNPVLLEKLAGAGGGKVLTLADLQKGPFQHDRHQTYQPQEMWRWLLQLAIILFPLDVALRRVHIDREEWRLWWGRLGKRLRGQSQDGQPASSENLGELLTRRQKAQEGRGGSSLPVAAPEIKIPAQVQLPGTQAKMASKESPETGVKNVSATERLLEAKRRARKRPD